jgi:RNA polymerase subunit RPABC4/transcription elongation factor Spt4
MAASPSSWLAVGSQGRHALACAKCGREIDLGLPSLDHHSAACPSCGVESVFFTWDDVLVQVVLETAPEELVRTLRWAQENLDEVEFLTLLCNLGTIQSAIGQYTPVPSP